MFFLLSWQKNSDLTPIPEIAINIPINNQHLNKGDTIRIIGSITHSLELTEVAVHITDMATNQEFIHNHFSPGNKTSYSYNSKYGINETTKSSFKVEVETKDSNGKMFTKELLITIN